MKKNLWLMVVITVVVVGGVGFFGGMKYQESQATNNSGIGQLGNNAMNDNNAGSFSRRDRTGDNSRNFGSSQNGDSTRSGFGRPVAGVNESKDNNSITVKLDDESSKLVILPDSVTVSKAETGSLDDLKTGEKVSVFGTENSDGSVTANNVQLNPMFEVGQRDGQGRGVATPTGMQN